MSITRRPAAAKVSPAAIDAFINSAPDAKEQAGTAPAAAPAPVTPARAVPASTRKQAISLTIDGGILAKVDERAAQLGLSRAAAMALACSRWVEAEGKGAQ